MPKEYYPETVEGNRLNPKPVTGANTQTRDGDSNPQHYSNGLTFMPMNR